MKIRSGFVSNSSSSSFIIDNIDKDIKDVFIKDKDTKEYLCEEWTKDDIIDWITSMIKREGKRNNEEITKEDIKENISLYNLSDEVIKEYDLTFWYAGRELQFPEQKWLLYGEDGYISYELAKKIIKKFNVNSYHLHMG